MTIKKAISPISPGRMTLKHLVFCLILICCLGSMGCATPGPKYVDLAYEKHHSPTQTGKFGIAPFKDNRKKLGQGVVGYRILTDQTQETYMVRGKNLSATLTELTRVYLEKTGFVVTPVPPWPHTLKGMAQAPLGLAHILSADINAFDCKAQKKGALTNMVLEIDLTFYLGDIQSKRLSTIPVSLTIERTELIFDPEKLAQFINQALEEIIEKAFPFK
jgi:hypothetical protein